MWLRVSVCPFYVFCLCVAFTWRNKDIYYSKHVPKYFKFITGTSSLVNLMVNKFKFKFNTRIFSIFSHSSNHFVELNHITSQPLIL